MGLLDEDRIEEWTDYLSISIHFFKSYNPIIDQLED